MYLFQMFYYSFLITASFIPGPVENMQDDLITYLNKARAEVKVVIKDKTRANNAQYQVYLMSEEIDKFNKQFMNGAKEVVQLYTKHESKPEDFKAVIVQVDEARSEGQKKILDARFKLRQYMTREEWKTVFGPKEKGSS